MFRNREELQSLLEVLLGSSNVYFQPPSNKQLNYPAIIYKISNVDNTHADNSVYLQFSSYDVVVVDYKPNSQIADKISRLPMCRFNTNYVSNNLNHFSFTLYY